MKRRQRSFRAIYEAQLFRPPKGASGRKARTFPMMARALRALPEVWLKEDAKHVWVLSDLHLGHDNIISYRNRPFRDVSQMNNALFDRWAGTVDWEAPDTMLVCVGDVAMKRGMTEANFARIAAMPGRKILVPGNHDFGETGELRVEGFDEVCALLFAEGDPKLFFTHVPIRADAIPPGWVNVHGHTHNDPPTESAHINVSVEQLDYRPVALSRIRRLASAIDRGEYPPGATTLERIENMAAARR